VLRIAAIRLTLSVTVAFVAGCGKTRPALPASASITNVRLLKYAHAVNLRKSDAPGMVALSSEKERNVATVNDELAHCMGFPSPGPNVVDVYSPRLNLGEDFGVTSGVGADLSASQNAALAVRYLSAGASKRGIRCIEDYLQRQYKLPGTARVITSLSNPLSGTYGSVGLRFRITTTGTVHGLSVTHAHIKSVYYEDLLYFRAGRANIELQADGEHRPFPLATERRLLSILYYRAIAQKL
jgi:hypothetical protein